MDLLPQYLEKTLPPLGNQQDKREGAIAYVRFFTPWSRWMWFATEYDRGSRIFFGLIVGEDAEYGYFSLDDLEAMEDLLGLRVVHDVFWTPKPLGACVPRKEVITHALVSGLDDDDA